MRRQWIVPLGGTILAVAAAVSAITWWAARDAERRWAGEKMDTVYEQLRQASYPLTDRVIEQIKNYSGVDAILVRRDGALVSTLPTTAMVGVESMLARAAMSSGKATIEDRRFHYRRYEVADGFRDRFRDGGLQELILLVQPPRDAGFFNAPFWAPIASGLVSVLAMSLVITALGSRIVRRIEDLETQVDRIAEGNFDTVEPQGPNDAIRRLSVSINAMSTELLKAQDWIARTERTRLISMIAGGMAHQLRNALTGASLLVQSFLRSHPEQPAEELKMAENQLKLAAEAVRRLLASDPNIELVDEPAMSIEAIHHAAEDCVAPYAQHQQVSMSWESENREADRQVPQGSAVVGALVSLLMNGIEAAGRGGVVRCEERWVGAVEGSISAGVRWRVFDSGPGPDPTLAILEPFVTSKKEGVGLGLAMAARVAQRCGGSLSWRREDSLTVFELTIPCTDPLARGT